MFGLPILCLPPSRLSRRGRGPTPKHIRARMQKKALAMRDEGATWGAIGMSLGVSTETLRRWFKGGLSALPANYPRPDWVKPSNN